MFNCACPADHPDGASIWNERMRTARKQYRCCECGEVIHPGESYQYLTVLQDGHWGTYRTCRSCVAIWRDLCAGYRVVGELAATLWETNEIRLVEDKQP